MKKLIKSLALSLILVYLIPVSYLVMAEDEPLVAIVDSVDSFQNYIDTDGAFLGQDVLDNKNRSAVHKISVEEDGWIFLKVYGTYSVQGCHEASLYSNFALTNKIGTIDAEEAITGYYVSRGDYYVENKFTGSTGQQTGTVYVGFMSATTRIKVDKITLSKDKSMATVTFDYDEDYLRDLLKGSIRVVDKRVAYTDLKNDKVWETGTRENALEKNSFKVTKNGIYTVRIAAPDDEYFCMVTFEVEGINTTAPTAPKIVTYTKGTKTITGTAKANTNVVIKISGKSYKATVDAKGNWSVTLSTALKEGQVITGYVSNAAGVKSKTTTKTVQ